MFNWFKKKKEQPLVITNNIVVNEGTTTGRTPANKPNVSNQPRDSKGRFASNTPNRVDDTVVTVTTFDIYDSGGSYD